MTILLIIAVIIALICFCGWWEDGEYNRHLGALRSQARIAEWAGRHKDALECWDAIASAIAVDTYNQVKNREGWLYDCEKFRTRLRKRLAR